MIPYWRTCLFKGIGSRRQSYIDLLTNKMVRSGFKQRKTSIYETDSLYDVGIEKLILDIPIFETPDGKFNAGIQIIPSNEDLQVGFILSRIMDLRFFGFLFLDILATAALCYIIKYAIPHVEEYSLALLFLVIFVPVALVIPYSRLSILNWNRQLMQILVETAKSMGSKQTTPFKRTWKTKMQGTKTIP